MAFSGLKNWLKSDFAFSTIALWICWLTFVGSLSQASKNPSKGVASLTLFFVLVGVYAYRSQKRRKLGIKPDGKVRYIMEKIILLALIYISIMNMDLMYSDPVPFLFLPAWVVIAYIVGWIKKYPGKQIITSQ